MSDELDEVVRRAEVLLRSVAPRIVAEQATPPVVTDPGAWQRAVSSAADAVAHPQPPQMPDYFAPFGTPLYYGGVLNTLVGPGGQMKTTLALMAAAQHAGYSLFVSLEKSERALRGTAQWVNSDSERTLVATDLDAAEAIIRSAPASADLLVVVDSTLSMMARMGLNEDKSSDVGLLEARLMEWNAAEGVGCIVTIDHTGHEKVRARGSSRKGQMIQGRSWVLTPQPRTSAVEVRCDKDNSGEAGITWSYDKTTQGPVPLFATFAVTPIEEVALAAVGIVPGSLGMDKTWAAIKAHADYPKWHADGLRQKAVRAALSTAHTGLSSSLDEDMFDTYTEEN